MQVVNILNRKNYSGFTLIEMMVVVTIIAILASISWSAYRTQIMKGKRSDAVIALTSARLALISSRSDNGVYPNPPSTAKDFLITGYRPVAANTPASTCRSERGFQNLAGNLANSVRSCEWYWDIEVTKATAATFTLQATPTPSNIDAECANLTLDEMGTQGYTATTKGIADGITINRCWAQ